MKKAKIMEPNESIFQDRDKEAKFWEENFDAAWKLAKPIKVKFAKNLSVTLNIRLDPKTLGRVRTRAAQNGLGPTQLIRVWIMEKLRSEGEFQTTRV
ncbi:hypothetical protein COY62_03300 [bacterium (Candidatus Howlettbacteria) CG_4_10_14_0_8_um_filter_40_9]|nr:MAG: hypothetical protein COY62_03300 [bacterium (Candidatus Howlettbacteria) CG_4_10_14_0_8_um_filter_40_9]